MWLNCNIYPDFHRISFKEHTNYEDESANSTRYASGSRYKKCLKLDIIILIIEAKNTWKQRERKTKSMWTRKIKKKKSFYI